MSYSVHIWEVPVPSSLDEATQIIFRQSSNSASEVETDVSSAQVEQPGTSPTFIALAERLTARYPFDDENFADCAWNEDPLDGVSASGIWVLGINSDIFEVQPFIVSTANQLGLCVYDMQEGKAYLPSGKVLGPTTDSKAKSGAGQPAMPMKKKEVRDLIYGALAAMVSGHGFKLKKAGEGALLRTFEGGFHRISVALLDRCPEYGFSLLFEIRIDAVSRIDSSLKDISRKYSVDATSAVANLDYFLGSSSAHQSEFIVTTRDDLTKAIRSIEPVLKGEVLPLLDRCIDVHGLDKLMNPATPPWFSVSSAFSDHVAVKSLIAARLANNPNFEKLAGDYEQAISKFHEKARMEFLRKVAFLRAYDVSNPPAIPERKKVEMSAADWPAGLAVRHFSYGPGVVVKASGSGEDTEVKVKFDDSGKTHNFAVGSAAYDGTTLFEKD
jgi:hypothetical protein